MRETSEFVVATFATLLLAAVLYRLRGRRRVLHGALYGFFGSLLILAIRSESMAEVNAIWLAKASASGALWAFTGWFLEKHKPKSVPQDTKRSQA